jgi:hypothetical protein
LDKQGHTDAASRRNPAKRTWRLWACFNQSNFPFQILIWRWHSNISWHRCMFWASTSVDAVQTWRPSKQNGTGA